MFGIKPPEFLRPKNKPTSPIPSSKPLERSSIPGAGTLAEVNQALAEKAAQRRAEEQLKTLKLAEKINGKGVADNSVLSELEAQFNDAQISQDKGLMATVKERVGKLMQKAVETNPESIRQATALSKVVAGNIAALEKSQQSPADNETSKSLAMFAKGLDPEQETDRQIMERMQAAAKIVHSEYKPEQIKNPNVFQKIKDTLIVVRVEIGKHLQGWKQEDIRNYIHEAYQGDVGKISEVWDKFKDKAGSVPKQVEKPETKLMGQLKQEILADNQGIKPEKAELIGPTIAESDKLGPKKEVVLEAEAVLAPLKKENAGIIDLRANTEVNIEKAALDILNEVKESILSKESSTAKVNYIKSIALQDPALFTLNPEARSEKIADMLRDLQLEPEDLTRKQKIEIDAINSVLTERAEQVESNQKVYLKRMVSELNKKNLLLDITPESIEYMSRYDFPGLAQKTEAALNSLDDKNKRHEIERAATLELRNDFLERLNIANDETLQELKNTSLEEIGVSMTQQGYFILKFNGENARVNIAKADQTKYKDSGYLVHEAYKEDPEKHLPYLPAGAAHIDKGIMLVDYSEGEDVARHELLHMVIDMRNAEEIKAFKKRIYEDAYDKALDISPSFKELAANPDNAEQVEEIINRILAGEDLEASVQSAQSEAISRIEMELRANKYFNEASEALSFTKIYKGRLAEIANNRISEETATNVISLNQSEDFALAMTGVKEFDPNNESHLAALVLTRLIRDQKDNPEFFRFAKYELAQLLMPHGRLDLAKVSRFIDDIAGLGLHVELRESSSDDVEIGRMLNELKNNSKLKSNLNKKERNILAYLFDEAGDLTIAPTEGENFSKPTEFELEEQEGVRYSEWKIRTAIQKSPSINSSGTFPQGIPFPIPFLGGGVPGKHPATRVLENLLPKGIPGTGLKFAESWAHMFPGLSYKLGIDLTEDYNVLDKGLLPFGWADHPRAAYLVNKGTFGELLPFLRPFMSEETAKRKLRGSPMKKEVGNYLSRGVQDKIGAILQASLQLQQQIGFERNTSFLIAEEAGGIKMDWYREAPNFSYDTWNVEDNYRNNFELYHFLKNKNLVDKTLLESLKHDRLVDRDGNVIQGFEFNINTRNKPILKGMMTESALMETLALVGFSEGPTGERPNMLSMKKDDKTDNYYNPRLSWEKQKDQVEGEEEMRQAFWNIGTAMMMEDAKRNSENSNNHYTLQELIEEVAVVDSFSPGNPRAENNNRAWIEIGGEKFDIEEVRQFISHYYIARQRRVVALGVHGSQQYMLGENNDFLKVEMPDISDIPPDRLNKLRNDPRYKIIGNTLFSNVSVQTDPELHAKLHEQYESMAQDMDPDSRNNFYSFNYYDDKLQIERKNNVTGYPIKIDSFSPADKRVIDYLFGIKAEEEGEFMNRKFHGTKHRLGVIYELDDFDDETRKGSEHYLTYITRYYQVDRFRQIADNYEKVYEFLSHAEKTIRWLNTALIIFALFNPAIIPVAFGSNLLVLNTLWAYTGSPLIINLREKWGNRKKTSEQTLEGLRGEFEMFAKGANERYGTTTLNMMGTHLKTVRKMWKDIHAKKAEDFEFAKATKTQTITQDLLSGLGSVVFS